MLNKTTNKTHVVQTSYKSKLSFFEFRTLPTEASIRSSGASARLFQELLERAEGTNMKLQMGMATVKGKVSRGAAQGVGFCQKRAAKRGGLDVLWAEMCWTSFWVDLKWILEDLQ